jgi:hypothetical protein
VQHSQQGVSTLGKKAPWQFFLPFFSFNKQKTEHQWESNTTTSWIPNSWKASYALPCRTESQEVCALRKEAYHYTPPASFKAVCINLQTQQVSNTHHKWLPHPSPKNIIQCSPGWVEPLTQQNWKSWTENCNLTLTAGVGWNAEPAIENWGGASSLTLSEWRQEKHERLSRGWMTSQRPKAGLWWITELVSED